MSIPPKSAPLLRLVLSAIAVALPAVSANADAPSKKKIGDVELLSSFEAVHAWARTALEGCSPQVRTYVDIGTEKGAPAMLTLGALPQEVESPCYTAQLSTGKIDYFTVKFLHRSLETSSPVYEIALHRFYLNHQNPTETNERRDVESALTVQFGRPEFIGGVPAAGSSTHANSFKHTMNPGRKTATMWWGTGKWDARLGACLQDCGPTVLTAELTYFDEGGKSSKDRMHTTNLTLQSTALSQRHRQWVDEIKRRISVERVRF